MTASLIVLLILLLTFVGRVESLARRVEQLEHTLDSMHDPLRELQR